MKKKYLVVGAVLSLSIAAVAFASSVYGGITHNEVSVAGLSAELDLYCNEIASGVVQAQAANINNVSEDKTEVKDNDKNKKDKYSMYDEEGHLKLNLNYDRLGIAKVDTYLNIRKKPNESSKVVGKLIKHSGCHIYYINKKGWAKIVSGNVTGFVKASYLVTDKKAEKMATKVGSLVATVNTPALKVRVLPSTESDISSIIAMDEDFDIRKEVVTKSFLEKYIKQQKIKKKQLKSVDYDSMLNDLDNWICIHIDNELAFVSKEYVEIAYKLRRAVKIGELQVDESSGVSSGHVSLVEYAKQFLGNRYVWGGTSLTNGADCSGFVQSVFGHYGMGLPRTSGSQAGATRSISSSEAKPGDLFFYGSGGVNHVAIYIGSGMIIHASNERDGIKISNAYYRQQCKIGRVMN